MCVCVLLRDLREIPFGVHLPESFAMLGNLLLKFRAEIRNSVVIHTGHYSYNVLLFGEVAISVIALYFLNFLVK